MSKKLLPYLEHYKFQPKVCGLVGDEINVSYRKEISQMMWGTVVTRVTFYLILHGIKFQRSDFQEFHYKNMRKFSWGASSCHFPSQLFCLILSKAPTAAKFTVLSFIPDLKRLLFSFPFLLSRHTYTAKCFFLVVLGDWENAKSFLSMQKTLLKSWLMVVVSFCLSWHLSPDGFMG